MNKIYDTTQIAKLVRQQLKKEFPDCKFSVTSKRCGGSSLTIALMAAPFPVFASDFYANGYKLDNAHAQLNYYQLQHPWDYDSPHGACNGVLLTHKAWEVLRRAIEISNLYNWDNSDIQTDYFDVNFYLSVHVGKWDQPFRIISTA